MPVSPADFVKDHANGSDSDTNLDDNDANDAPEYYQPISAADDDDEEDSGWISDSADEDRHENGEAEFLENGNYCSARQAENGMSSLHLNDDAERNKSSSEDEEEEEDAFIELIEEHGTGYAKLKKMDEAEGENARLWRRSAEDMRWKARNMLFTFYKARLPIPRNFDMVPLNRAQLDRLARLGIHVHQDRMRAPRMMDE